MTRFVFVFLFLCIFAICNGQICSGPGTGPVVCCSGYVWVDSSKSCEPCAVGFFGPQCAMSCGYPSYGKDCQSTCFCSNEMCHHVKGCFENQHEVTISRLCSGPSGLECCTGYFWNSTLITCEPCNIGFNGPNCKEQCIYPSYGKDCQLTCNCSKESCSQVYGCHKSKVTLQF
uniref:Protein draper-like isoform X2 n=1 Tax=Crassostrea virginica TaxID=6565 RepID=A0A8B8ARG1_CRAVI|nr:protein draper-like isoform X2 [Crassostrea virginica]